LVQRFWHRCAALAAGLVLTTAFALADGMAVVRPEQAGMSSERLHRIDDALRKDIDKGKLPGAVVLVSRRGQLVYAGQFGFLDRTMGIGMPEDAIFRIYSMTKPLVSVAAMILVEDGRLQLTDPVSKHLPKLGRPGVSVAKVDAEFAKIVYTTVPSDREMTVQDLLRHTAGLAYGELTANAPVKDAYAKAGLYFPNGAEFDVRDLKPEAEVDALAAAPLAHQPGTVWEYSLASDLLGRVVEAASGMRLADFLEERLFRPLHMRDTGFYVAPENMARLAEPLAVDPATGKPTALIDVTLPPGNDSGGAGGVSSAMDYLRFGMMLLNGGELDGTRILSRSTVSLMASDHLGTRISMATSPGELLLGTPGYTFGLGFAVRQAAGVAAVPGSPGEFMWGGYAGTYFWVDPKEELVGVYMSQMTGPTRQYYRRLVKQLVYQAIVD
jgi:CubicO group peptidase (beta-lactamase class C family)